MTRILRRIKFNTGRPYTKHGQRIIATLYDDGLATFFDIDRMVDGEIEVPAPELFSQQFVLSCYDSHEYHPSERSHFDGVTMGGCNSPRLWEDSHDRV